MNASEPHSFAMHLRQFFTETMKAKYRVLFPSALSVPVRHQRVDIIQTRINAIAWILAFAIPLWSCVDAFAFPDEVWAPILSGRLLAGAAFASFILVSKVFFKRGGINIWLIYLQLVVIFAIPTLFYLYCHLPLDTESNTRPFAAAIAFSYYLLPFTVLTAISIFPLTLLECACIATPLLIIYSTADFYFPGIHSPLSGIGAWWVMASVASISVLVSISQLQLLIKLITYSAYDPLTNCLSRRSGEEIVRKLWSYSVRNKGHLAIAFVDLDHFKLVNDQYGHRTGDKMLAEAATCIKKALRESDFVIRWGGEEFLVIMSDANMDNATAVITRLCRTGFGKLPNGKTQTASVGIAERMTDEANNNAHLIELADQRLYQAKTAGRNCCIGNKVVMLR